MPQMKPIFWMYLYLLFLLIIMIYSIMNYYIKIFNKNYLLNKNLNLNKNWKW